MGRGQIVNFLNIEIKQQVKKVTDTVSGIYILNSLGNAVTGMEFVTEINDTVIAGFKFFGMVEGNQYFVGVNVLQISECGDSVITGSGGDDDQILRFKIPKEICIGVGVGNNSNQLADGSQSLLQYSCRKA